ncbi:MAG: hypothetical protein J0I66_10610 [Microbacterium sp.]|nr:hypothetical protein [Microbacterium sp.]
MLYVEDDPAIADMTIEVLSEVYDVVHVSDGRTAVTRALGDRFDVMVIDEQDRALAPQVEALGMRCLVTDTMMTSDERKAELASAVLSQVAS